MPAGTPNQPWSGPTPTRVHPHPDGDRVEREVEHDHEHRIHDRRGPAADAERIGDAHGAGDEQGPRQTDDQRGAVDDEDPVGAVVVGLEDELVALLQQEAERRGAEELEER